MLLGGLPNDRTCMLTFANTHEAVWRYKHKVVGVGGGLVRSLLVDGLQDGL